MNLSQGHIKSKCKNNKWNASSDVDGYLFAHEIHEIKIKKLILNDIYNECDVCFDMHLLTYYYFMFKIN